MNNKKITVLVKLLEKYSGKKVLFQEDEKIEEAVRRKQLDTIDEVKGYIKGLLKKYNIKNETRVFASGNVVRVDNLVGNNKNVKAGLKQVGFELEQNKFMKSKRPKVLNQISYTIYTKKVGRFIVLLQSFE